MQVLDSPITQALKDSVEALKDKTRIAKMRVLKTKMEYDERFLASATDNIPPLQKYPGKDKTTTSSYIDTVI